MSHDAHIAAPAVAFDLDAGALCLDFVNTLEGRLDPVPREWASDYAALLAFGVQTETLEPAAAEHLRIAAELEPRRAAAAHRAALALREALFRLFSAIAAGESPADADLATLNAALSAGATHGRIARAGARYVWRWDAEPAALDRPLWPIAQSAAELLLEGGLGRVRQCAASDCAWLFLDTSRNHSRRWCSMSSCGNRAKVEQFRKRQRAGA